MTDVDVWCCKLERLCTYRSDLSWRAQGTYGPRRKGSIVVALLDGAWVCVKGIMRIGNRPRQVEERDRDAV